MKEARLKQYLIELGPDYRVHHKFLDNFVLPWQTISGPPFGTSLLNSIIN